MKLEETLLNANSSVASASIANHVAKRIEDELIQTGVINFDVTTTSMIIIDQGQGVRARMMASCENLEVRFLSNTTTGTMQQNPSPCKERSYRLS
ncbi:hypothetical protein Patl1_09100 [Pistacia atlantica]|uniref:Uncharacterized protein n=1 Tax=Pistacia atlantica TaxID=434234 RepID=A0ACC1AKN7_9ROSI|nr:hypothetical protein Patl1_09100 [Pistacia atlantica]